MKGNRETNDRRMSGIKPTGEFDGMTRAKAIGLLLDRHNQEYYLALGQVVPRPRRGLGTLFGPLVTPHVADLPWLFPLLLLQVLLWSGTPQKPQESAAILANAHWSNMSPSVAPEGVLESKLLGSQNLWYWRGSYRIGGYRVGSISRFHR